MVSVWESSHLELVQVAGLLQSSFSDGGELLQSRPLLLSDNVRKTQKTRQEETVKIKAHGLPGGGVPGCPGSAP